MRLNGKSQKDQNVLKSFTFVAPGSQLIFADIDQDATTKFGNQPGEIPTSFIPGDLDALILQPDGTTIFLENTDTSQNKNQPNFILAVNENFPQNLNLFSEENLGVNSRLSLADLDVNGTLDAVVVQANGTVKYYLNTYNSNKPSQPRFQLAPDEKNPFKTIKLNPGSNLAFADIDGDGDQDAYSVNGDGAIAQYENTGNIGQPVFTQKTNPTHFQGVNVPVGSQIQFVDLHRDGNLDAVTTAKDGNTTYFQQNTTSQPIYGEIIQRIVTSESGEQVSFGVRLTTPPQQNVVVKFQQLKTSEHKFDRTQLTFTPENWNQYQLVTVTGVDDSRFDGTISYSVTLQSDSDDPAYRDVTNLLSLVNDDNEAEKTYTLPTPNVDTSLPTISVSSPIVLPESVPIQVSPGDGDKIFLGANTPQSSTFFLTKGTLLEIDNGTTAELLEDITIRSRGLQHVQVKVVKGPGIDTNLLGKTTATGSVQVSLSQALRLPIEVLKTLSNNSLLVRLDPVDRPETNTPSQYLLKRGSKLEFPDAIAEVIADTVLTDSKSGVILPVKFTSEKNLALHTGTALPIVPVNFNISGGIAGVTYAPLETVFATDPAQPLYTSYNRYALGDLNGDGKVDLVFGNIDGTIGYASNLTNGASLQFDRKVSNPFEAINRARDENTSVIDNFFNFFRRSSTTPPALNNSVPSLVDIDNDGDLDAFVSFSNGRIEFYRNIGTTTNPQFTLDSAANPLSQLALNSESVVPSFADLDQDGDQDVVIGTGKGLLYYSNTSTKGTDGKFTQLQFQPVLNGLTGTYFSTSDLTGNPLFTRVDDNLDWRLAVLDAKLTSQPDYSVRWSGKLRAPVTGKYTLTLVHDRQASLKIGDESLLFLDQAAPNGQVGTRQVEITLQADQVYDIQVEYAQGNGNATLQLGWSAKNDQNEIILPPEIVKVDRLQASNLGRNPFALITELQNPLPTFADIDRDGDFDLVVKNANDAQVRYFRNDSLSGQLQFSELTDNANPLDWLKRNEVAPSFADFNRDNQVDLFLGQIGKQQFAYRANQLPQQPVGYILPGQTSTTINVRPLNDQIAKGDQQLQVQIFSGDLYTTGSDPKTTTTTVTIKEDDVAGILFFDSQNNRLVSGATLANLLESGSTQTIGVRLNSQPQNSVTLTLASTNEKEGKLKLGSTDEPSGSVSVIFNSKNWHQTQFITLVSQDDAIDDGDVKFSILSTVKTSDPIYSNLTPQKFDVTNIDNDTVGLVANGSLGDRTNIIEGVTTAFGLKLRTQPTASTKSVRVLVQPINNQLQLNGQDAGEAVALNFDTRNWDQEQTVRVNAIDDDVVEGTQLTKLNLSVEHTISYDQFGDLTELILRGNAKSALRLGDGVVRLTEKASDNGVVLYKDRAVAVGTTDFFNSFFRFSIQDPDKLARGIAFFVSPSTDVGGLQINFNAESNKIEIISSNVLRASLNLPKTQDDRNGNSVDTRLNNGQVWNVWVDYDGSSDRLELRLSDSFNRPLDTTLTYQGLRADLGGSTTAYVGMSGSSGGFSGKVEQDILSWTIDGVDPNYTDIVFPNNNNRTINFRQETPFTAEIRDNDLPTVSIKSGPKALEVSSPSYFTIALDNVADPTFGNTGVKVNYRLLGGSATNGRDYQAIPNEDIVRVAPGELQTNLLVFPIDDFVSEGTDLQITSYDSSNGNLGLKVADSIRLYEGTILTFAKADSNQGTVGKVDFSNITGVITDSETNLKYIEIRAGQTTKAGITVLSGTLPLDAGVTTGVLSAPLLIDSATATGSNAYAINLGLNSFTLVPNSTIELGNGIKATVVETASKTVDTNGTTVKVQLNAEADPTKIKVNDLASIRAENVIVELLPGDGYKLNPNATQASLEIADNDLPGVRLIEVGDRTIVKEGDTAAYQISLMSEPQSPVTIYLTPSTELGIVNPNPPLLDARLTNLSADGKTGSLQIRLFQQPSRETTISLLSPNQTDANRLVFNSNNWEQFQTIDNVSVTSLPNRIFTVQAQNETNSGSTINLRFQQITETEFQYLPPAGDKSFHKVTFDASNWYIPQNVILRAIDNQQVDPSLRDGKIQYAIATADPSYAIVKIPDQSIGILDRIVDNKAMQQGSKIGIEQLQKSANSLELPIIGSIGKDSTITGVLGGLTKALDQGLTNVATPTAKLIEQKIREYLNTVAKELAINDVPLFDSPDVKVTMDSEEVRFAISIGQKFSKKWNLATDGGVPALGLQFDTQGQLEGFISYDLSLVIGVHKDFGFFIDTDQTGIALSAGFQLTPDFAAKAKLGFFQLDATNLPTNPTAIRFDASIKLNDLDNRSTVRFFDVDGDRLLDARTFTYNIPVDKNPQDNKPDTNNNQTVTQSLPIQEPFAEIDSKGTVKAPLPSPTDNNAPETLTNIDWNGNKVLQERTFQKREGVYRTTIVTSTNTYYFDSNRNGKLDTDELRTSSSFWLENNSRIKEFKISSQKQGNTTSYYFDANGNGQRDSGETLTSQQKNIDANNNNILEADSSFAGEGQYVQGVGLAYFDLNNNGRLDVEPYTDTNKNGKFDPEETYTDTNKNGKFDNEPYTSSNYDPITVEQNAIARFFDVNGDGKQQSELVAGVGSATNTPEPNILRFTKGNEDFFFLDLNGDVDWTTNGTFKDIKLVKEPGTTAYFLDLNDDGKRNQGSEPLQDNNGNNQRDEGEYFLDISNNNLRDANIQEPILNFGTQFLRFADLNGDGKMQILLDLNNNGIQDGNEITVDGLVRKATASNNTKFQFLDTNNNGNFDQQSEYKVINTRQGLVLDQNNNNFFDQTEAVLVFQEGIIRQAAAFTKITTSLGTIFQPNYYIDLNNDGEKQSQELIEKIGTLRLGEKPQGSSTLYLDENGDNLFNSSEYQVFNSNSRLILDTNGNGNTDIYDLMLPSTAQVNQGILIYKSPTGTTTSSIVRNFLDVDSNGLPSNGDLYTSIDKDKNRFYDLNGNNIQDSNEPLIEEVVSYLDLNGDSNYTFNPSLPLATTGVNNNFVNFLSNLVQPSSPNPREPKLRVDALGVRFLDVTYDGVRNPGEPFAIGDAALKVDPKFIKTFDIVKDENGKRYLDRNGDGKVNLQVDFAIDNEDIFSVVAADTEGNGTIRVPATNITSTFAKLMGLGETATSLTFLDIDNDGLKDTDIPIRVSDSGLRYLDITRDGSLNLTKERDINVDGRISISERNFAAEPFANPNTDFSNIINKKYKSASISAQTGEARPGFYYYDLNNNGQFDGASEIKADDVKGTPVYYYDDGSRLTLAELVLRLTGKQPSNNQDLFTYEVAGTANLGLKLKASGGTAVWPAVSADLNIQVPFPIATNKNQTEEPRTTIELKNVKLDLGSFLTNVIKPWIDKVNQAIEPVRPLMKFLRDDIQLTTRLGVAGTFERDGRPGTSILELLQYVSELLYNPDPQSEIAQTVSKIRRGIVSVVQWSTLIGNIFDAVDALNQLAKTSDSLAIKIGDFNFSNIKPTSKDPEVGVDKVSAQGSPTTTSSNSNVNQQLQNQPDDGFLSKLKNALDKVSNIQGLKFPILSDFNVPVRLLMGEKGVDLITFEPPKLDLAASIVFPFPSPASVPPILTTGVKGTIGVTADLGFGFDTYGASQWRADGSKIEELYKIFDGLYIRDVVNGVDIPEVVIKATAGLVASLDAVVASASAEGGLLGTVNIDLVDEGEQNGTSDGKVRFSDIAAKVKRAAGAAGGDSTIEKIGSGLVNFFDQLFRVYGTVDVFAKLNLQVGAFGVRKTLLSKEMTPIRLFEFAVGGGKPAVGRVLQSYLEGATIFWDANLNGEQDADEPVTKVEADGSYYLDIPSDTFDLNGNDILDPTEGRLVAIGGTDSVSGYSLSIPLYGLPDAQTFTPLTTLQVALLDTDLSSSRVEDYLKIALGLPATVDFDDSDPIGDLPYNALSALDDAEERQLLHEDILTYTAHVQVTTVLSTIAEFLVGLSDNQPSLTPQVIRIVAEALMQAGKAGKVVNLADFAQLQTLLANPVLQLAQEVESLSLTSSELEQKVNAVLEMAAAGAALNADLSGFFSEYLDSLQNHIQTFRNAEQSGSFAQALLDGLDYADFLAELFQGEPDFRDELLSYLQDYDDGSELVGVDQNEDDFGDLESDAENSLAGSVDDTDNVTNLEPVPLTMEKIQAAADDLEEVIAEVWAQQALDRTANRKEYAETFVPEDARLVGSGEKSLYARSLIPTLEAIGSTPVIIDLTKFFNDLQGRELQIQIEGLPTGFSFDSVNNILIGTPAQNNAQDYELLVRATTADGEETVNEVFQLRVIYAALDHNTIAENTPVNNADGTLIGQLELVSPDNFNQFALVSGEGGEDNELFSLVGNKIYLKVVPDYETKPEYHIRIVAQDATGQNTFQTTLVVNVSDVDETPVLSAVRNQTQENLVLQLELASFSTGFQDPEGASLKKIKILSLPKYGTLQLNGQIVGVNQEIDFSNWANQLTFVPEPSFSGAISFQWTGCDGQLYASEATTYTVEVNAVRPIVLVQPPNQKGKLGNLIRRSAKTLHPSATQASDNSFPLGSLIFDVQELETNEQTIVDILIPKGRSVNNFVKLINNNWQTFLFDGEVGAEFTDLNQDGTLDVRLHLKDNGLDDTNPIGGIIENLVAVTTQTPGLLSTSKLGIFRANTHFDSQVQVPWLRSSVQDCEFGYIPVLDELGTIKDNSGNLVKPDDPNYLIVALQLKQVLYSGHSNGANTALSRYNLVNFTTTEGQSSGQTLRFNLPTGLGIFYLTENHQTNFSLDSSKFQAESRGSGYQQINFIDSTGQTVSFEVSTPALVVPGSPGDSLMATVEFNRVAAYRDSFGFYQVDDLTGGLDIDGDGVVDLQPGDTGYAAAAINRAMTAKTLETAPDNHSSKQFSVSLASSQILGMFIIANASVDAFMQKNPTNAPRQDSNAFFSFGAANPDKVDHMIRLGGGTENIFGFEDMLGGGDRDFNDLIVKVNFLNS